MATMLLTLFMLGCACPVTDCLDGLFNSVEAVEADIEVPTEKNEVEDDCDKLVCVSHSMSTLLVNARKIVQSHSFLNGVPPTIPIFSPPPELT